MISLSIAHTHILTCVFAHTQGLEGGLCSVIATNITPGGGGRGGAAKGEGAQGFRDVEDWVKREAAAFYRTV